MTGFYDRDKSREENEENFREARHNKEVLQYFTAAVAVVTGVCTAAIMVKRAVKEFS